MRVVEQIDIKNRTYDFYNDMINITKYHIGYITIIKKSDDYANIYSLNSLYLIIDNVSRYIEEKGMNKYLVFR